MLEDVLEGEVVVADDDDDDAVEGTAACGGREAAGTVEGGGGACVEADEVAVVRTGLRRCSGIGPPYPSKNSLKSGMYSWKVEGTWASEANSSSTSETTDEHVRQGCKYKGNARKKKEKKKKRKKKRLFYGLLL